MSESKFVGGFILDSEGNYRLTEPIDQSTLLTSQVPGGFYSIEYDRGQYYLNPQDMGLDGLTRLESDPVSSRILERIRFFLSKEARKSFEDLRLVHREGLFLYGEPGTGKTSLIRLVAKELIEKLNAFVFVNPDLEWVSMIAKMIQKVDPNRFFLMIFEDCEDYVNDREFLALLDGESSFPNSFSIATTNYIEKIPPRIRDRPSRFASVIEVGEISAAVRREYFVKRLPSTYLGAIDLEEWVELTSGLTIDDLKHVVLNYFVYKVSLEDSIRRVRELSETIE